MEVNINEIIHEGIQESNEEFKKYMLQKRKQFHEKIHAAFVLETSYTAFGRISKDDLSWLHYTYPNSVIEKGTDQGASWFSVTPRIF